MRRAIIALSIAGMTTLALLLTGVLASQSVETTQRELDVAKAELVQMEYDLAGRPLTEEEREYIAENNMTDQQIRETYNEEIIASINTSNQIQESRDVRCFNMMYAGNSTLYGERDMEVCEAYGTLGIRKDFNTLVTEEDVVITLLNGTVLNH